MSRIGKKPIALPDKVKARVEDRKVLVEGPLGKLLYSLPEGINAEVKDSNINISIAQGAADKSALFGTARARVIRHSRDLAVEIGKAEAALKSAKKVAAKVTRHSRDL